MTSPGGGPTSSMAPPRGQPGNNRPPTTGDNYSNDSDNDAGGPVTPERGGQQPQTNDGGDVGGDYNGDDYDDDSVARAAAQVSVMPGPDGGGVDVGGGGGGRARPPGMEAANAAIQGTGGEGGEASAFEVVDEGGELVRVRFHEFLQN